MILENQSLVNATRPTDVVRQAAATQIPKAIFPIEPRVASAMYKADAVVAALFSTPLILAPRYISEK